MTIQNANTYKVAGLIALLISGLLTLAVAAPPTAITNYYAGAVIIDNTVTNVGDTGLSVSNAYICVPLSTITNAEYTSALVTNDVRPFVSAMIRALDAAIDALASSNRFTTFTVAEDVNYSTSTNRTVFRSISEQQTITVTPGYPTE